MDEEEVFEKSHSKAALLREKKHENNERVQPKSRKRLYQGVGKEV